MCCVEKCTDLGFKQAFNMIHFLIATVSCGIVAFLCSEMLLTDLC